MEVSTSIFGFIAIFSFAMAFVSFVGRNQTTESERKIRSLEEKIAILETVLIMKGIIPENVRLFEDK